MNKKTLRQAGKKMGSKKATTILRVAAITSAITLAISASLPSVANVSQGDHIARSGVDVDLTSGGITGLGDTSYLGVLSENISLDKKYQNVASDAQSCADPSNVNGLAYRQAATIKDMQTMIMTPINTDKIFDTANKNGCFNALNDFPNLSISIPSLSSIANSLKNTLLKYAVRKVCNAVNDALSEVIEPINEVFEKISEHGQIDLTGEINRKMYKELYSIDKDLGRVADPIKNEINWNLSDAVGEFTDNINLNEVSYTDVDVNQSSGTQKVPDQTNTSPNSDSAPKSVLESTKSVISSIF